MQVVQPYDGSLCLANFLLWLDEEDNVTADVLNVKIVEFDSLHWERLKLDREKKKQTINIIEKYFNGNEMDAIREICILSEFITQKLVEKIKKKKVNMDFGSMVNKLCKNGNKNRKGASSELKKYRYNYKYLGSMLYPIYFLRNNILHGKNGRKNIEINKNHAQIIFYL